MENKKILKILIVLEIVFGLTSIILDLSLESNLPQEFQAYISRTDEADITALQIFGGGLGVLVIIGQIIAWVGLWKLWNHARLLYTLCLLIGVLLYLLLEPVVYYTSIGAMFSELTTLAEGAILGMIYFSDLRNHFVQRKTPNN